MAKVVFETVSGDGGTGHYLDDYRCGGNKPRGGGSVTHRAVLYPADIIRALEGTAHGKAALDAYAKDSPSQEAAPATVAGLRDQFELTYATVWAADREGDETPQVLAAEVRSWRDGDTYPDDLPRLRFGWEAYQWAFLAFVEPAPKEEPALPDDVRAALLRVAKGWLLNNYVGGQKKLAAWNDHYASLTHIYSFTLEGDTRSNLRLLCRLVRQGVLIEQQRYKSGVGARSFTAPRHVLDEIGQQAVREWEAVGYRVGELMPAIPAGEKA